MYGIHDMCDESCPQCYSNRKGRSNYPGHRWFRAPPQRRKGLLRMALSRPSEPVSAGSSIQPLNDPEFKRRFPTLLEYLTQTTWDDGSPRQTSTLLIFVDDGVLKACLNDRACERALWVASGTLSGAIAELDESLADPHAPWRASRPGKGRGKSRN